MDVEHLLDQPVARHPEQRSSRASQDDTMRPIEMRRSPRAKGRHSGRQKDGDDQRDAHAAGSGERLEVDIVRAGRHGYSNGGMIGTVRRDDRNSLA